MIASIAARMLATDALMPLERFFRRKSTRLSIWDLLGDIVEDHDEAGELSLPIEDGNGLDPEQGFPPCPR